MTIPKSYLFLVVGILLVAFLFSFKACTERDSTANHYKALYEFEHQVTDSLRNRLNLQVTEQHPVITTDQEAIRKLSADVFALQKNLERKIKEVDALVRAQQIIRITDSLIKYDTVPGQLDTGIYILPPKRFQTITPHYSVTGMVERNGVRIDSIMLSNTISFRVVEKKVNFWGKRELMVQAVNSNPLVGTSALQSMVYKPKKSFFEKAIPKAMVTIGLWEGLKFTLKSINR